MITDTESSDEECMRVALGIAAEGMRLGEMPIGAVVVLDGEVVSAAHTQERSQQRLLVHADLLALDAADHKLRGQRSRAALYATLEPCVMCLGAAFTTRIGEVVFALESPSDGGTGVFAEWERTRAAASMPGYRAPTIRGGVLRRESAALLRQYAALASPGWARDWAADLAALAEV